MKNELLNLSGANNSNSLKMTSWEIAEVTGKRHDNVVRDIEKLNKSYENLQLLKIEESFRIRELPNGGHKKESYYELTKMQTMDLMTGYNTELRIRVNRRWEELENKQVQKSLPGTFAEALRAYADEVEKNEKLIGELKVKNVLIAEYEPKVTYYDQILSSVDTITITQIAKDYGMSAQELNKLLHEQGIQYKQNKQWILYQKYAKLGYTKSKTVPITYKNGEQGVALNTQWTQKGRLFLYELLKSHGYLPLIEQDDENI